MPRNAFKRSLSSVSSDTLNFITVKRQTSNDKRIIFSDDDLDVTGAPVTENKGRSRNSTISSMFRRSNRQQSETSVSIREDRPKPRMKPRHSSVNNLPKQVIEPNRIHVNDDGRIPIRESAIESLRGASFIHRGSATTVLSKTTSITEAERALEELINLKNSGVIQAPPPLPTPLEEFKSKYTIRHRETGEETKKPKTRRKQVLHVFNEILDTETTFQESLHVVIDQFLTPIRTRELLNDFQIVSLFSNIELLQQVSSNLLEELQIAKSLPLDEPDIESLLPQWIGEIFEHFAPIFTPIYATYCTNQPTIDSHLREMKKDPKFSSFLRSVYRKDCCQKQDLNSFLIRPLQRLCKYPLLLRELSKYSLVNGDAEETEALENGSIAISQCVEKVNGKVKEVENVTKLAEVNLELTNGAKYKGLIMNPTREFITNEYILLNNEIRNIYMFNHFLMICEQTPHDLKRKKQSDDIEHFVLKILPLEQVTLENTEECSFTLLCNGDTYCFTCKSSMQRKKWIRLIEKYRALAPELNTEYNNEETPRSRTIGVMNQDPSPSKPSKSRFGFRSKHTEEKQNKEKQREEKKIKKVENSAKMMKQKYDELELKYKKETMQHLQTIEDLKRKVLSLQQELDDREHDSDVTRVVVKESQNNDSESE